MNVMGIPEGEISILSMDAADARHETAKIIDGNPRTDYGAIVKGNQSTLQKRNVR